MSYAGITVLLLAPGQTPDAAVSAATAFVIQLDDDAAPVVTPMSPSGPPVPLPADVVAQMCDLMDADAGLLAPEVDPDGTRWFPDAESGSVEIGRSRVVLQPGRGGFDRMWSRLLRLREVHPCVAWDSDYDEILDLDLPLSRARELYK